MKVGLCSISKVEIGQKIVLEGEIRRSNSLFPQGLFDFHNLQVKDSKLFVTLFYEYDGRKVNAIT